MMRTKDQFKAGVALSSESLSSKASSMGRQLLLENKYNDVETTLRHIEKVTLEEVYEAARLLTDPSKIAVSVVGDARFISGVNDYCRLICFQKIAISHPDVITGDFHFTYSRYPYHKEL